MASDDGALSRKYQALFSDDLKERVEALKGIYQLQDLGAIPVLRAMAEEEQHPELRAHVIKVIEALSRSEHDSRLHDLYFESCFPHPISVGYRKLKAARRPLERINAFCGLVGSTVQFLSVLAVQDLLAHPDTDSEVRGRLRDALLKKPPSDGAWQSVLRTALETSSRLKTGLFAPSLSSLYFDRSGHPTQLQNAVDRVVQLRNTVAHPSLPTSDEEAAKILDTFDFSEAKAACCDLLRQLLFLKDLCLFSVVSMDRVKSRFIVDLGVFRGYSQYFEDRRVELTKVPPEKGQIRILDTRTSACLSLHPWIVYEPCKKCHEDHFFFFASVKGEQAIYITFVKRECELKSRDRSKELVALFDEKIDPEIRLSLEVDEGSLSPLAGASYYVAQGTVLGDRYQVVGGIGSGGFGEVYRAVDLLRGTECAVKVMLTPAQPLVERFKREAKILARLDHRNIVRFHDFRQDGAHAYFVMELVVGVTLREKLSTGRQIPLAETLELMRQAASALEHAHAKSVVHRDLKPENLMVDVEGVLKVMDFGLARIEGGQKLTVTGIRLGTPDYMAPEQRSGSKVDDRADLYSLGVVFHECLTGQLPERDKKGRLVPASRKCEDLPSKVDELLGRLLQDDPDERVQKAEELRRELEAMAVKKSASTTPRPEPGTEPTGKCGPVTVKVVLTVTDGPIRDTVYTFEEHDTFIFGRDEHCHAHLPADDKTASRHHFILEVNPPEARLRDLGSLNGTFVNGVKCGGRSSNETADMAAGKVYPEVDVGHGDTIRVGKTVFTVQVDQSAQCTTCRRRLERREDQRVCRDEGSIFCPECFARQQPAGALGPDTILEAPTCASCGRLPSEELQGSPGSAYTCSDCLNRTIEDPRVLIGPEATDQADDAIEGIRTYEVLEMLGRGATGVVYLARRREDGVQAAIKMMIPRVAASESLRRKFLREIEITTALRHDHIVEIRGHGAVGPGYYFIMEFCSGGDVAKLMNRRGGRLWLDEAAPLMVQALRALAEAHRQGVVHRDLKPANLLLTAENEPKLKIGDFGLAKEFEKAGFSGMTRTGTLGGTPYFMAREQLTDFKCSRPVTDVWAIAATFYHMLTGQYPYDFSTARDPLLVILSGQRIPLRDRLPSLPQRVCEVIEHGLAPNIADRFSTAAAFLDAFESTL